jgi:hypothetical protein
MTYTLRFHLGEGKHKGWWQVHNPDSSTHYVNPATHSIKGQLKRLTLSEAKARRIYAGTKKTVCATIKLSSLEIHPGTIPTHGDRLSFNPRRGTKWEINGQPVDHRIVKDRTLTTNGTAINLL